ncbi:ABC transporter [Tetragenococcus halophilus subsp. flandriensis]|uniref:ABC transporter ATP-binding protein n=1 Tax=Tetragenococcus halophilus TaxID=51669 RepID=UPI0023E9F6B9|nr:ABC transporter ATP-binding protein [Tetragenococcus halophilus]GMA09385.1 ABC transporter [Tetragenococcus halophilus subsp. flandriensis]
MSLDVVFQNVSKIYKNYQALDQVSFSLMPGKTYGLIGRNGAGKTTLLSLLASFQLPSSGQINVDGKEPFENAHLMSKINFVYETDYGDEHETVESYLADAEHYRPNFDYEYAQKLVERFDLPLDKPVNEFSTGMQSALNIVLGFASRCPITIFDEVYLGMDAPNRELFYQEIIEEQSRRPRTLILSTHLVSEMDYLFDHVLILDQGQLIIDEAFDQITQHGVSITGDAKNIDIIATNLNVLNSQQLGGTKSIMVYGEIDEAKQMEAKELDLEIGPLALQDLFIHLTKKERSYEK